MAASRFFRSRTGVRGTDAGWVFDVQRYSVNDGPGIRTTVFFKGCPLRCLWCDNPESQKLFPELLYFESQCLRCHRCAEACPIGATTIDTEGAVRIHRGLCLACGSCARACLSQARAISGRLVTVDELLEIARKDTLFYRNSGGGVTASGGEATYQPAFLLEFFRRCQEAGLHTTLDTCGYVKWDVLESVLEYTDLVLFDIKHMDPARHGELTGVDNRLILENARRIAGLGKPLRMRMPLIPEGNDSVENILASAEFISGLGLGEVDILPYHQLGTRKYEALGREYELSRTGLLQEEQVGVVRKHLESLGLTVCLA